MLPRLRKLFFLLFSLFLSHTHTHRRRPRRRRRSPSAPGTPCLASWPRERQPRRRQQLLLIVFFKGKRRLGREREKSEFWFLGGRGKKGSRLKWREKKVSFSVFVEKTRTLKKRNCPSASGDRDSPRAPLPAPLSRPQSSPGSRPRSRPPVPGRRARSTFQSSSCRQRLIFFFGGAIFFFDLFVTGEFSRAFRRTALVHSRVRPARCALVGLNDLLRRNRNNAYRCWCGAGRRCPPW